MGFVAICTALYDYQPQSADELDLKAGDVLYILEKSSDDDWWKAKKRAVTEDEDEPEGLVPSYYVEASQPIHSAKALYDYTRQTEEEVSFAQDASLHIYDTSDPDWTLVAVDDDYGFAPANYIEIAAAAPSAPPAMPPRAPAMPARAVAEPEYEPEQQPSPPASPIRDPQSPNARLAGIMGGIAPASPPTTRSVVSPPLPARQLTPEASDEEAPPPKPQRPQSTSFSAPAPLAFADDDNDTTGIRASGYGDGPQSPGGFHLYNVSEMVSALGKRKKMPTTLGLNIATGKIMLSPEKSRDGPTQEWTADKLDHYSIEGKHVFLELKQPSRSLDLHAGAKDTAKEIVAGLGEISGAHRSVGLKDVIAAASGGQKKGVVLYDFMAQGDDEVTVAEGDEVVVLDDTKSEEWWNVRRVKNGKEGVVPSSYVEITGAVAAEPESRSGVNAGLTPVQQNRLEEQRLAKEAARSPRGVDDIPTPLPERGSSLAAEDKKSSRKDRKASKSEGKTRSKPDLSKVRTWTDHSGSFKVDAQFLGIADGKIHLHKVNGVKIAVPVSKMSQPDLDYVEKVTHESIDDHIPVADLIKMKRRNQESSSGSQGRDSPSLGASVEAPRRPVPALQVSKASDYDWFEFFLSAGVGPHQCERYAQAMIKDSMDETILPDIKIETLRTLGVKEGDAIKVMKHLDQRYGRNKVNGEDSSAGGLFTGPGGTLKDNSRKRPEANRANNDTVDAQAFQTDAPRVSSDSQSASRTSAQNRDAFDDDAWTPKPSKQEASAPKAPAAAPPPATKPLSQNMQALSLLDQPLEPTPAPPRPVSQPQVPQTTSSSTPVAAQQPMQTGATPQLFQQVGQALQPQDTMNAGRQRPQAPQQSYTGSGLLPPPPRPMSAPQNAQMQLQPLQAQLTGIPSTAQPAPPGQSLDEITAARMQQLLRPQATGFMQPGFPMQNGFQAQPTGFQPQQFGQMQQPYLNGNASGSPFADPRSMMPQPTGYNNFQPGLQPGGINSMLPPALTPQRTGFPNQQPPIQQNGFNQLQPQPTNFSAGQMQPAGFQPPFQPQATGFSSLQPQPTGFGQMNNFSANNLPPVPPIPQQSTPAPLMPQKTGPAPDIKFGMNPAAKRLAPQPTGRRANLAQASKYTFPCRLNYADPCFSTAEPLRILKNPEFMFSSCMTTAS